MNEILSPQELTVWSMALGAIASVALARMAGMFPQPSLAQVQAVAFHLVVFLLVLIQSGIAGEMWPALDGRLHLAQVLAGPVCVALSNFWIRGWLQAARRDRFMSELLRASSLLLPVAGLACLAFLPPALQVLGAGLVSLAGAAVTLWMTIRAWLMGDRLAPVMAVGCLLVLPALAGLHAIAMGLPLGLLIHSLVALAAVLGNGFTGFVLWRRDRHEWRAREAGMHSQFDPVTKLHSGAGLVHRLIKAQRRRERTGRDGAVLAIMMFDVDRIATQAGTTGLNEVFMCMASRIQHQVGVVNPVGRYYDRCFVTLVETIHSPTWLRTLGLRVASSLRRPVEVLGVSGERISITADIGVGLVHLAPGQAHVEDILHDAQLMAMAARAMRSRTAILDPKTGEVVPVEHANLGPRRHRYAQAIPRTA